MRADEVAAPVGELGKKRTVRREVHVKSVADGRRGRHGKIEENKVSTRVKARCSLEAVATPWTEHPLHFIDFEGSIVSGILEYGVVTMRGGKILETTTGLCRATGRVRVEDVALHGLEAEAVETHAPFAGEFARFARLRETGPLAAHFASAENALLKAVWPYPRTSPDFVRPDATTTEWGPWIDTGRLYPQLYPGLASAKLAELIATFGLQARLDEEAAERCPPERRRYHAALYDALAGALLLTRLAAEPTLAGQSLGWLLTMSTLDAEKRDALQQESWF
jgi:DNA polymerase III epsilon subunit-like protein